MNLSDLSPDALAQLEARLMEDVQVVRRMRALMEEYRHRLVPAAGAAPIPEAAPAPAAPRPPRKPLEEVLLEALFAMPAAGFRFDDVRRRLQKDGYQPKDATLKTWMNRMIREGKVVVQEKKSGRGGSIYRGTVAGPPGGESTPPAPENGAPPPVSGPPEANFGGKESVLVPSESLTGP